MQERLTIIARCDLTGLGIQSRNFVRLLNPSKIVIINSEPFNGNKQYPEWYDGYKTITIDGFIKPGQINSVLDDTDTLLTFEIPYSVSYLLFARARERGIKTILQNNWEFLDYLQQPNLPLPDLLINHSYWNLYKQKELFPNMTEYCPSPTFMEDYEDVIKQNIARTDKIRFLHIAGRKTYEDRNGTNDLLESVKLIPKEIDFELVIKTQTTEIGDIEDSRVTIDTSSPLDEKELYRDFDAMILPRRYAGACLPMQEALASSLPVIMTDIDPNNKILPSLWLVPAEKKTSFSARTTIDVYSADHEALAARIAQFAVMARTTLLDYKSMARNIAIREYSSESVLQKWNEITKNENNNNITGIKN